jgi:hypothetical protein
MILEGVVRRFSCQVDLFPLARFAPSRETSSFVVQTSGIVRRFSQTDADEKQK